MSRGAVNQGVRQGEADRSQAFQRLSCLKVVTVSRQGEAEGHSRVSASVAVDIIELFTEGRMRGLRQAGPEPF